MSDFKLVKLIGSPININSPINFRGEYSNTETYALMDSVSYNGASYVALQETTGNLPTDQSFWQILVSATAEHAASVRIQRIATEPIIYGDVLKFVSNTTVGLADNNGTIDNAVVAGVAMNSANTGEYVTVLVCGIINDPAFSAYSLNSIIFLDVNGGTTDDRPIKSTANFLTIIGRSLGGGDLFIDIRSPMYL